jgi:hypothetical protein
MFNELRQMAQPLMQNGGSIYDVIQLYSTKSVREMKRIFKTLKDKQDAMQQQQMQMQQQQLEQQQQQAQAQLEQQAMLAEQKTASDNYQKELDRLNKKEIAIIQATGYGNVPAEDVDKSGVPDVLELSRLTSEQAKANKEYELKRAELNSKNTQAMEKLAVEREKLQVARENQANDLAVAKENAKGRAKQPKPKK